MPDLSPWYLDYPLAELKGDPEVMARSERRLERFRLDREARKQKIRDSLKEGLEKFDFDLPEAWEDTEGYDEIISRVDRLRHIFTATQMSGFDLSEPRTKEESMLSKKMTIEWGEIQKDIDLYKRNKEHWSDIHKMIVKQGELEPHERTIDIEATEEKLNEALGVTTISERNKLLTKGIVVSKAKDVDLQKDYSTRLNQVMTGQESWEGKVIDPATGKVDIKSVAGTSTESLRAANKKLIETMPERVLKKHKTKYDADLYKEEKSFEEWMMRYSPVSLKKVTIKEPKEAKGVGTEPAKDEEGNVIWTALTKNYKSPLYNRNVAYKSAASIGLTNLFTKTSDRIDLPIKSTTINMETGETEINQNQYQPTMPIMVNFYAVADEDIKGLKIPSYRDLEWAETIPKGEKIPVEVMEYIHKTSKAAGKPLYKFKYEPFVDQRVSFEKLEITEEYDIKSFARSDVVPYWEMEPFLMTRKEFAPYKDAIRKKYGELNYGGINVLFGESEEIIF